MIMFIPDVDILKKAAFFQYGASKVLGTVINYLIKQIVRIIDTHKVDCRNVCRGAVIDGEPKIIWVKVIDCPNRDKILSLRTKFNAILEETIAQYPNHYIIDPSDGLNTDHFDHNNFFQPEGIATYWQNIDQLV